MQRYDDWKKIKIAHQMNGRPSNQNSQKPDNTITVDDLPKHDCGYPGWKDIK